VSYDRWLFHEQYIILICNKICVVYEDQQFLFGMFLMLVFYRTKGKIISNDAGISAYQLLFICSMSVKVSVSCVQGRRCTEGLEEKRKERDHLKDIGLDGRIILKWTLNKYGGLVWTGFIWVRVRTGGRHS
jgi:hypothetical protein